MVRGWERGRGISREEHGRAPRGRSRVIPRFALCRRSRRSHAPGAGGGGPDERMGHSLPDGPENGTKLPKVADCAEGV